MFIRIEPSSSSPIYRQIMDQIRYQVAAGILKAGDKVPSVRQLAGQLAVNQNTILKVYNELCRSISWRSIAATARSWRRAIRRSR